MVAAGEAAHAPTLKVFASPCHGDLLGRAGLASFAATATARTSSGEPDGRGPPRAFRAAVAGGGEAFARLTATPHKGAT